MAAGAQVSGCATILILAAHLTRKYREGEKYF
jgi:hypothetical protein